MFCCIQKGHYIMYYELLAHLIGDYVLQSKWMALNKTKRSLPAAVHVCFYTLPFLYLTQDAIALVFIAGTHFVIDRFGLATYVCKLRNCLQPIPSKHDTHTPEQPMPPYIDFWLTVIVDNTMHLVINAVVLAYTTH